MSEQTNRYQLPYLMPSQAQKHVTHNEAIRLIDGLTNLSFRQRDVNDPPADPSETDTYLVGTTPTGEWENHPGKIAVMVDGAWMYSAPFRGLRAFDENLGKLIVHDGSDWHPVSADLQNAETVGINTSADQTNRLAVKSDAVLFSSDDQAEVPTGDIRLVLNKEATGDVNSVIFQTGYSGRVELGCPGSDDFEIRVSDDGSNFLSALRIDASNGNIGVGKFPGKTLDIEQANDGAISRIQVRNPETSAGSGAGVNVSSGGYLTQFLQYSAGSAYFVSNSNSFYIQTTGNNPTIRFFTGSVNPAIFSTENVEFKMPAKLAGYNVSQLPSPASAGIGAVVYVSDESGGGVPAFSDGSAWRRFTDRQVVA